MGMDSAAWWEDVSGVGCGTRCCGMWVVGYSLFVLLLFRAAGFVLKVVTRLQSVISPLLRWSVCLYMTPCPSYDVLAITCMLLAVVVRGVVWVDGCCVSMGVICIHGDDGRNPVIRYKLSELHDATVQMAGLCLCHRMVLSMASCEPDDGLAIPEIHHHMHCKWSPMQLFNCHIVAMPAFIYLDTNSSL